uniref:Metaxin 2 n=1 Tax=Acanthochromis polyacanthus TaxID=80966 RepID=A0A3Q1G852_9TELE
GPIVQFTKAKLYVQWCDDATAAEVCSSSGLSLKYIWFVSGLLQKRSAACFYFLFQVYEDVSQCCQALSQRLGTQPYFFNKQPTELDALVFGHLFTILTTRLTSSELAERIKSYSNLLSFCKRIEQSYFYDKISLGSSCRGFRTSRR